MPGSRNGPGAPGWDGAPFQDVEPSSRHQTAKSCPATTFHRLSTVARASMSHHDDHPPLHVKGLVKSYKKPPRRRRRQLRRSTPGEIVGLLGPNGAGKTTSFRMTVGARASPDKGKCCLGGNECAKHAHVQARAPGHGLPAPGVAAMFRADERFATTSSRCSRAMPLGRAERHRGGRDRSSPSWSSRTSSEPAPTRSRGASAAAWSSARALATRSVDPAPARRALRRRRPDRVEEIQVPSSQRLRTQGIGILITDHNVRETLQAVDRAYIIHQGHILREGHRRRARPGSEEVRAGLPRPQLRRAADVGRGGARARRVTWATRARDDVSRASRARRPGGILFAPEVATDGGAGPEGILRPAAPFPRPPHEHRRVREARPHDRGRGQGRRRRQEPRHERPLST
jgi:lipopolysaccharide export system ATP-binding protein